MDESGIPSSMRREGRKEGRGGGGRGSEGVFLVPSFRLLGRGAREDLFARLDGGSDVPLYLRPSPSTPVSHPCRGRSIQPPRFPPLSRSLSLSLSSSYSLSLSITSAMVDHV